MSTAKELVDLQAQLASKRSQFDSWWQSIAQRVLPAEATFTTQDEDGTKRTERLFSGKPVTDNERFAAVMDELLTPRTQQWHALAPQDDELAEAQDSKVFLERLNKLLFTMRYRPRANFAAQNHQGFLSVGAFGNMNLFTDEEVGSGPRYRGIPLRESFWSVNHVGQIDTMYRRYCLNARQAVQQAKELKWTLPATVTAALDKEPFKDFEFLHCVKPNDDRKYGKLDASGMPWASFYVAVDGAHLLSTGGYTSWPYATGRYMVHGREVYGRSPAMAAWPGILTLNEEKKTILRAGQLDVYPPTLLGEEGALEPFSLRSGALNYGMMSANGTPLAQPYKTGANVPLGLELMAMEQMEIEEAFLVAIFKILSEHPQMTATQVLEITQQKATLLAPMMGRQQSEYLGPLIEREIDILSRDSRFDWIQNEMPDELREAGGAYKIEYRSPLARAMRAQDGVAIMRTLEALPAAMQVDPNAALVYDIPESMRELGEINGYPAKLTRSKEDVAQMIADKAEADQIAQAASVAPEMSQAALNAAKAEQLRTGSLGY